MIDEKWKIHILEYKFCKKAQCCSFFHPVRFVLSIVIANMEETVKNTNTRQEENAGEETPAYIYFGMKTWVESYL